MPATYTNVLAAVDALHNPPEMYGFVAATKIDENFMSQVLEHVLLANGVSPVGPDGIMTLDELVGLRDSAPPTINDDTTPSDLAAATGIATNFAGPSNPDGAAWGDIRYFGITSDASTDAAMEFVQYSMSEGYGQTLAIAPEGKFPVRRGTADNPTEFSELWATLDVGVDRRAPLGELYDQAMIDEIVGGLDAAQRWGVAGLKPACPHNYRRRAGRGVATARDILDLDKACVAGL